MSVTKKQISKLFALVLQRFILQRNKKSETRIFFVPYLPSPSVAADYIFHYLQSPVGMISLVSTISITVFFGALGRCITPFVMVMPWFGFNSIVRSSRSINNCP